MSSDYWHEDSLRLEQWLEELRQKRNQAEQEAQPARSLHLDMEGPIKAAEAAVQRLSAEISDVERLVERVKAGYPYAQRLGFEDAVDATGEVCTWTVLSEVPVPGTILGYDDADVRLPAEVQKLYAQAVSTQLFERFEVCMCFEPPDADRGTPVPVVANTPLGEVTPPGGDGALGPVLAMRVTPLGTSSPVVVGNGADRLQPPLLRRFGFRRRLTPGVRPSFEAEYL